MSAQPFFLKDEKILADILHLKFLLKSAESEEIVADNKAVYYSAVIQFSNAFIDVTTEILVKLSSYPEIIEEYISKAGAENVGEYIQAEIFSYLTGKSLAESRDLVTKQNTVTESVIRILDQQENERQN